MTRPKIKDKLPEKLPPVEPDRIPGQAKQTQRKRPQKKLRSSSTIQTSSSPMNRRRPSRLKWTKRGTRSRRKSRRNSRRK